MLARLVDLCEQIRQSCFLSARDLSEVTPEGIFEAYASLVSIDDDGSFDD